MPWVPSLSTDRQNEERIAELEDKQDIYYGQIANIAEFAMAQRNAVLLHAVKIVEEELHSGGLARLRAKIVNRLWREVAK